MENIAIIYGSEIPLLKAIISPKNIQLKAHTIFKIKFMTFILCQAYKLI